MKTFKDLTGRRFGRLMVVALVGRDAKSHVIWRCRCECGTSKNVRGSHLGTTKSCGCLRRTQAAITVTARNIKHGRANSREYLAYRNAKRRCTDPNDSSFSNYGGRGIEFHFDSFEQFFREIGPRPTSQHSVDRIKNDRHYELGNVRWATRSQQQQNKRRKELQNAA